MDGPKGDGIIAPNAATFHKTTGTQGQRVEPSSRCRERSGTAGVYLESGRAECGSKALSAGGLPTRGDDRHVNGLGGQVQPKDHSEVSHPKPVPSLHSLQAFGPNHFTAEIAETAERAKGSGGAEEAPDRCVRSFPCVVVLEAPETDGVLCALSAPTVSPLVPAVQLQCLG